jgi:hypothetical protein
VVTSPASSETTTPTTTTTEVRAEVTTTIASTTQPRRSIRIPRRPGSGLVLSRSDRTALAR